MKQIRPFRNRTHAGKQLAAALLDYAQAADTIVLALPRGGVPVGFAVARELGLPLDIILVRKLGFPGHEEFAMGAVGSGGIRVLQPDVVRQCGIGAGALDALCARELDEIARRERQYRGGRRRPELQGKTVILVDDGLATGSTMRAAIEVVRQAGPAQVVAAVPVGAPDTCHALRAEVDRLVCLRQPASFQAVSQAYSQFDQTADEEVQDLLALAWRRQQLPHQAFSSTTPPYGGRHERSDR